MTSEPATPLHIGPVYIIEGWFGDQEWIEAVYATEAAANRRCEKLWETRTSAHEQASPHSRGLHKFAVVMHEVLDA